MAGDEEVYMEKSKVEDYRHAHESLTEWNLRRTFLLTHIDTITLDRLLCLASCFINVECYGCKYPALVMAELRELAQDIRGEIDEHRERIQSHRKIQFVKASEESSQADKHGIKPSSSVGGAPKKLAHSIAFVASSSNSTSSLDKESTKEKFSPNLPVSEKSSHPLNCYSVTKSDKQCTSDPSPTQITSLTKIKHTQTNVNTAIQAKEESQRRDEVMEQKFSTLVNHLKDARKLHKNSVETIHVAITKSKMTANASYIAATKPGHFKCQLTIDCIPIATGEAPNKKLAKHHAFDDGIEVLCRPGLRVVVQENSDRKLVWQDARQLEYAHFSPVAKSAMISQQVPLSNCANPRKREVDISHQLASFILVEPQVKPDNLTAVSVLHRSASFNKATLEFDFSEKTIVAGEIQVRCRLLLNGQTLADIGSETKQGAKQLAAEMTLAKLKATCWTMQIKKHEDTEESGLSKEEVLGKVEGINKAIPESNIGSKLLQKMGWTGGGVGKEGGGIAEPISVNSAINRRGLGLSEKEGIARNFLPQIKSAIENYASSGREDDLVFSPDFSKAERALIHRESQKLGLKTHSHGHGEERYLVVSRKRNAHQLLNHIQMQGGETSKYVLMPPGSLT